MISLDEWKDLQVDEMYEMFVALDKRLTIVEHKLGLDGGL